ncbi:MAG: Hsp20/alpha crystallin family protein [Deltaproteobacteria bacterium]|nr:Hsp20/alpha crystallin family protein [Deltaproteobacteria bacterium]
MFEPTIWRFGRTAQPWREMQRLQNEVNRLFSGASQAVGQDYPPINIWMGQDDLIVTAEIPGVKVENIDISVIGDRLTLNGYREIISLKEGESYHRQERNYGPFSRTLQLPFNVNATKVDAKYDKGILTITLPRAEEDKPKKIAIKSE